MGKLTDIKIVARNDYGDKMEIITPVSVTKENILAFIEANRPLELPDFVVNQEGEK